LLCLRRKRQYKKADGYGERQRDRENVEAITNARDAVMPRNVWGHGCENKKVFLHQERRYEKLRSRKNGYKSVFLCAA